jgi:hypothetical protein
MSFNSDFDRAFIARSLGLVREYSGPNDATLLLNCLLGLLVVPKESCLAAIPKDDVSNFALWGLDSSCVQEFGHASTDDNDPHNLRGLVWRLRNSIAHFRFRPVPESGVVEAFEFRDQSGFRALVGVQQLRDFVERLALHIEKL